MSSGNVPVVGVAFGRGDDFFLGFEDRRSRLSGLGVRSGGSNGEDIGLDVGDLSLDGVNLLDFSSLELAIETIEGSLVVEVGFASEMATSIREVIKYIDLTAGGSTSHGDQAVSVVREVSRSNELITNRQVSTENGVPFVNVLLLFKLCCLGCGVSFLSVSIFDDLSGVGKEFYCPLLDGVVFSEICAFELLSMHLQSFGIEVGDVNVLQFELESGVGFMS